MSSDRMPELQPTTLARYLKELSVRALAFSFAACGVLMALSPHAVNAQT